MLSTPFILAPVLVAVGVWLTVRGASLLGVSIMGLGIALPLAMFAAKQENEQWRLE